YKAARKLLLALQAVEGLCGELSLQCYTCRAPTDIRRCTRIATCKLNENACRTTELSFLYSYPFFGNITITRGCSSRCVPSSPWGIGEKHPVSCCYTDLCNSNPNGVVGLKAHHRLLLPLAGL
uniref:Snake toxin/toxin-like domain-containing protein n=1 Tax=Crocodylus porosus TaxID=8502 RepID=A0A7M4F4X9_CROPO